MAKPAPTPPRTPNSSSLEDTLESLTQKFLETIASRGKDHRRNPKETEKLLEVFYRPGRSNGLIAQKFQRILVVKAKEADEATLTNGDAVRVHYGVSGSSFLDGYIKRISEYTNALDEFGVLTLTLLIEWVKGPDFIENISQLKKGAQIIPIVAQTAQVNNFIINPRPPNSEPDPPIQNLVLGSGLLSLPVAKSDFSAAAYAIIDGQQEDFPETTIKVVVSDTGLKFNLCLPPHQTYTTWDGHTTHFPIAPNPNRNATPPDPNRIGFCSLTNYLDDTYPLPPRDVSFPGGIPQDDGKVLRNPHDDHEGRHGTTIAAIVAQNPAGASAIIPLKIFDFLGFGTLFDILCGFNYIFARIEAGENIRIVNASWGAGVPDGQEGLVVYELLERKIAALQTMNVFVLASAGNRDSINDVIGHDLAVNRMVPACYSSSYKNVITVTTVAERWKKCLFNRRNRSHYLNQELHDRLLATGSFFERLLNLISNIIPDGYRAVENYSPHYVGVGVAAHPVRGFFPTPFAGALQLPIAGSSFATAFMSAYVVRFLRDNPEATRAQILASLPTHSSLNSHVEQGRYLELSTVTGATIEANFATVLRAILSAIS